MCNKCDMYYIRLKNTISEDVQQIPEGSYAHQDLVQTLRNKMM